MDSSGKSGYGKAIDIWSMGTLAYELATGSPPHAINARMSEVFNRNSYDTLDEFALPSSKPRSSLYQEFINKCVADDPNDRPTIDELLDSEFMSKASQH